MTYVFWQNVLSIHQSALIKALSKEHDVILVVEKAIANHRLKEGWGMPSMGEATIIVAPNNDRIEEILNIKNCQHIFSGINAFPMVYSAFKRAIKKKVNISVFLEPYDWRGEKGLFRRWKYWWLFKIYGSKIQILLTTGRKGEECYQKSGFPNRKIRQFGYFTEQIKCNFQNDDNQNLPTIIFIGRIDYNKNIMSLLNIAKRYNGLYNRFIIIGSGPIEEHLKKNLSKEYPIDYIGVIPNDQISTYLSKSDLLILPSFYDGWGAVVNEALSVGTRVLCSCNCGASILLDGEERGGIFSPEKKSDLEKELKKWLCKGRLSKGDRLKIQEWANKNISGEAAAKYLNEVLTTPHEYILPPWLKNS